MGATEVAILQATRGDELKPQLDALISAGKVIINVCLSHMKTEYIVLVADATP